MYAKLLKYSYYLSVLIITGIAGFAYFQRKQMIFADEFSSESLSSFMSSFYPWAVTICAGLAIIMLIYSGFLYVTSAGNVEQANRAKEYIIGALSGLVFLILTALIYQSLQSKIG